MITLYIKTHRITGLKYFGKTTCDDPYRYTGGGKVWRRHLMKHGFDYDTEIYLQSEDQDYVTQEALRFSRAYDIVNSPLWANLQEENGIDGYPLGISFSEKHRENIGKSNKGKVRSQEARSKMSKAKKGKIPSQEHRDKISGRLKGRTFSQKHLERLSVSQKGKVMSEEARIKNGKSERIWLITYPNGEEQIISNLRKFCEDNNLDKTMYDVVYGKLKQHKGYAVKKMEKLDDNR